MVNETYGLMANKSQIVANHHGWLTIHSPMIDHKRLTIVDNGSSVVVHIKLLGVPGYGMWTTRLQRRKHDTRLVPTRDLRTSQHCSAEKPQALVTYHQGSFGWWKFQLFFWFCYWLCPVTLTFFMFHACLASRHGATDAGALQPYVNGWSTVSPGGKRPYPVEGLRIMAGSVNFTQIQ